MSTMEEYQAGVESTRLTDFEDVTNRMTPELWQLLHSAVGLAGEAGEILDLVKKVVFHGHDLDSVRFKEETGDAFWYLTAMVTSLREDLRSVAAGNLEKLRKRYPEGFSEEASINRGEK